MVKITILIIDDEIAIARLLSKVFTAEGYNTLTAASAEEALEVVNKEVVDLVFMDLRLPGIGGIEAIRQMKKSKAEINFVVMTAFGDMVSVKEATELGVFDYITKPFDLDYVRHLVRHIENSRLKILPYSEYMNQLFSGELTLEEVKQKKATSFKEEIGERLKDLKDIKECVDKEVCRYYQSPPFPEAVKDMLKKMVHNFYFIIIASGVVIGILFGYVYAKITSKNLYNEYSGERKVTIFDFYKSLNELRYWMQKHTEQGIVLDKDMKFRQDKQD